MSTETKQYVIQTTSGDGWYAYDHVEGTYEKALELLRNRRKTYPKTGWRVSEVVPLAEPAEISGWQVCFKGEDEVWVPASWTRNYRSIEEAREYLSRYATTPGGCVHAIFKVSGVQEQ